VLETRLNGVHKIWGSKISSKNKFKAGGIRVKNSAKVSRLDGRDQRASFACLFMADMAQLNESFGNVILDSDCNIIFYPKEKIKTAQRMYSQHSYWEEDLCSVNQFFSVYPSDSNFTDLANLFDGIDTVPAGGQITFR